jgi:predicted aldo/keto reductase-like oxidoreductase
MPSIKPTILGKTGIEVGRLGVASCFGAPASDCYRFALSIPAEDVCMCRPKDTAQMKEALRTLELGPLNREEVERMRKIGDYVHAHTRKFF